MCILVILRNRVEGWPLLVGANRDEYRDRPWEPPRRDGDVVAPRDLRAGGTWLALADSGLLVAVTNRPEPDPDPDRPSRGTLAMDLARAGSMPAALRLLRRETAAVRRNGFHVLLADADEAMVGMHPGGGGRAQDEVGVPDGLHTLTNRHGLDELDHRGSLDPLDLPPGADLETARAALASALRTHAPPGPPGPDEICKHGESRGTLSSAIVGLPAAGSARRPLFEFAADAPCRARFERVDV